MTKKRLIVLSVLSVCLRILSDFFAFSGVHSLVLHSEARATALAPQAYISYEYKTCFDKKEAQKTEFNEAPDTVYYRKHESGYDLVCRDVTIYGNKKYNGDGEAEWDEQSTIEDYNAYFKDFTKAYSDQAQINLPSVAAALRYVTPLVSVETKKGNVTEYKLYYGENFYKSIFLFRFKSLHGELFKPVVVQVENGKIKSVSLKADIQLEPNGQYNSRFYCEYKIAYDYEKAVTPPNAETPVALDRYQTTEIFESGFEKIWFEKFDGDTYYCVSDVSDGVDETLLIYDLKTRTVTDRLKLPFSTDGVHPWGLITTEKYVYVNNENTREILRYDWSERTLQMYMLPERYHVKAAVGERLLLWFYGENEPEKAGYYFADLSKNEFTRAAEYDQYDDIYYQNGHAYAWWDNDGVWGLSLLTEQGEWEERIELGEMTTWYFCADGIVFSENTYVSEQEQYARYRLYDWDLSYIKSYETQGHIGKLWGETDDFVYYNEFVFDKKKNAYYVYANKDSYENYGKWNGVFYNSVNGDLYCFEPYSIVKG